MLLFKQLAPLQWIKRPNSSVEIRIGDALDLPCTVDGYPPPTVQWRKIDSNQVLSFKSLAHESSARSAILTWSQTKRNQEGDYECFASNQIGPDLVTKTSISVLGLCILN